MRSSVPPHPPGFMEQTASPKQRLDDLIEALDTTEVRASRPQLEIFTRQLLARASADMLERRGIEQTAEDVVSLFRFVESAGPDAIEVRVRGGSEQTGRIIVETVMPDCPFIVNTLREYAHARNYQILHLLHPVLALRRDEAGRIVEIGGRNAEGPHTSIVHMVLEGHLERDQVRNMESEIRHHLGLVSVATSDFEPMLERCREIGDDMEAEKERLPWRVAELEEIQDLLEWLQDGCFVFLGYRAYDLTRDEEGKRWIRVRPDSGLGILRNEAESRYHEPAPVDDLPPDLRARVLGGPLLIVSKTNAVSPVHRRARMDYLGVKEIGPDGEVTGERRFLGLFTAKAYSQDASTIPILRRKLREILEAEGVTRGSHDYNQIVQIFNSMPKEELFLSSVADLVNLIEEVMETEGAEDVRVLVRSDPLARGVNVTVLLPQHRFSEDVREGVQKALLSEYRGQLLNYHLAMDGGDQARLHFYLSSELDEISGVDIAGLERRVRQSVRSWEERLRDAMEDTYETERAQELVNRHEAEFTAEYRATVDVETAMEDIRQLESLELTGVQQLLLEEIDPARPNASLLKVFAARGMYVLSDLMPILENLGLRVIQADAYELGEGSAGGHTIHVFEVETPATWGIDRQRAAPRMAAALAAIQARRAEDDSLNSLILSAGLEWRQVALLRAYANFAFRMGAVSSRAGVRRPLAAYPEVTRLLYDIFEALHDPSGGAATASSRRLVARFHDSLEEVRSIEDDRTYRRLLQLVQATVRTNFFQARARERADGMVALKIDCDQVEFMPAPRPRFEIYVNSGRTEGAHLRMDAVARGGIRWSDRSEDFRVEVLGLVKTQQVKNAVIVPAGAKGAYIVKQPSEEKAARRAEGVASYRQFIRGLLDLTDNVVDGDVRHPPEMVVRDGADPYLVVAADKGTAQLSDPANELAAEYDFWLGDAFASGGSQGYDHKELGITARGAWECVKRHFRELGRDIQDEDFSVVGIGDMSGDVFGNGMLLSRHIRLVGAFDHRHIFLDPDPDPGPSWRERQRLYEMGGSTWMDYDPDLLSEGGGIFERGAKRIPLSAQVRERFDIEEEELNGDALIRAVLTADVDLLWNGGIGTYVKASDETHGEVGDPENDAVRVSADALRATVVGEGGNLGFTQMGRVEYALGGGRINTDALDNSGGVDMSDHEVNLKILLNEGMNRGTLDREDRNSVLREITDEVVAAVLQNNYDQSRAVSLDEYRVREYPAAFRDALIQLERDGILDRQLEGLPSTEQLVERQEAEQSLTRPELAMMLAYAKMGLKAQIRDSELSEDPALMELLIDYFPAAAREAAGEEALENHRLRRRIIATRLANLFIDRMGATSQIELVRETGKDAARVIRAWYAAYQIGGAERLYRQLSELDDVVPAGVQIQWILKISRVLERSTRWLLTNSDAEMSITETIRWFEEPVRTIRGELSELLTDRRREEMASLRALHETDGLHSELAEELASFHYLDGILPVAELARRNDLDALLVGRVYFGLTSLIDFPWLQHRLERISGADLWEQRAAKAISLQLETARARISANIVRGIDAPDGSADVVAALRGFRDRHASELARIAQVMEDVRTAEQPGISALMVVAHAIASQSLARDGGAPPP